MKSTILTTLLISILCNLYGQTTVSGEIFSKINIKNNAKIIIRQDSICSVRYTGNDKQADVIKSINNGTLNIDGSPDNELNITMPVLKEIKISGHGIVTGISTFNTDDLNLQINGDGKIVLNVVAKKIDAEISGIGKIVLSGTTQEADFSIPGSGKIDAIELKTIKCNVNIAGLGKCMVDAIDELNTNISGSGTVSYKNMPKKLSENVTGIGKIKSYNDDSLCCEDADTTRFVFGKKQFWIINKKDSTRTKDHKIKPIWAGFEMGINSYMDNGGTFTLSPGKENFDLRVEKSISVGLNILQHEVELGRSNIWLFTGLGITWNNYRFQNNVVLVNGSSTSARVDSTSGVTYKKSKLVASYLTAPVMLEVFTSRYQKKAFHIGAGGIFGLRIGSHTKQKVEVDGHVSRIKDHDDFNLTTFRYGFRAAVGYGKFNIFADYYASTLFRDGKGPVLYPVNVGITFVGF